MKGALLSGLAPLCAALAIQVLPVPVAAQQINCANPTSQVEYTSCAARAFEAADAELNAEYQRAIARARSMDAMLRAGEIPSEDILRNAQRAWIPFRDGACEAESLVARGGTIQNQIYLTCLERLTRIRTDDLRRFGAF